MVAIVTVAGIFTNGCRKLETPNGPTDGQPVTTTIVGQVTDESGASVSGVTVTTAGSTAITDANGLFSFHNVSVPSSRAFVIAQKGGYFDGARAGIPTANGVTYLPVRLATKVAVGTVNAASGGTVTFSTGAKLILAPGGVVNASGSPVSGPVTIYAKHLDPGNQNFSTLFPGDMMAQNADGSRTGLWSYGVMAAELRGPNNELLQPAPGSPATISVPITAGQQSVAPSSVPLWYFDETLGLWKEEGSATKTGTTYSGTVQHFTFWNYDMRCDYGIVTGRIVCNDVPIPGVKVNFGAYVEGGQPNVITDGGGNFSVRVPAHMPTQVVMQVLASENNGIYYTSTPIPIDAPANGTLNLGDIGLNSPCPSYMQGSLVDCNNQQTAGMVIASFNGGVNYVYSTDGQFKLVAPASQTISVAATAASGAVAQPQTITAGSEGALSSIPPIVVCGNQTNEIRIDIPGTYGYVLTFSPDGSKIATANATGTDVIVLDANTGNKISQFTAVTSPLKLASIKFSPDGTKLLTITSPSQGGPRMPPIETYGGVVDCWQLNGTRLTAASLNSNYAIFSDNGQEIYLSSTDSAKGPALGLCDYNIAQGKIVKKLSGPSYAYILGMAANGTQLVLFAYNQILYWDIATDKSVNSIPMSTYYYSSAIRTSPDGSIVGFDYSNTLTFYNLKTGQTLTTGTIAQSYASSYDIMNDNATFLAQYQSGGGNTVGLFKITDGTPTHLFTAAVTLGTSYAVAACSNGKLAAAIYNSEIRIWNVN